MHVYANYARQSQQSGSEGGGILVRVVSPLLSCCTLTGAGCARALLCHVLILNKWSQRLAIYQSAVNVFHYAKSD